MTVSIIIPTYNRNAMLVKTLTNVLQYQNQYHELIVVDQSEAHDPQTQDFLDALTRNNKVIFIHSDFPNLPNARNLGIKKASGDIVLFIDDDVTITKNCISIHRDQYNEPQTGCVTGKVEIDNSAAGNNIVFKNTIPVKHKLKKILFFFLRKKAAYVSPVWVLSDYSRNRKMPADTCIGCNMSFRKEIFERCGYFDINYTGNALREDTDMSIRVRKGGYNIIYNPEAALVHHMENSGGTRSADTEKYWHAYFKNQCYFFIKNFHSPKFLIKQILFFDFIRCKKNGLPASSLFKLAYTEACSLFSAQQTEKI